jgi:hypothetical protein
LSKHVAFHRHFQLRFLLHENDFIVAAKINDIYQAVSGAARGTGELGQSRETVVICRLRDLCQNGSLEQ